MAKEHKVRLRLEGKDDASDEVKKVESNFSKLGKTMGSALKAGAVAATAALVGLAFAIKKAAEASDTQALAVLKLDTALQSLGPEAAAVSAELQQYAADLQKVTVAGDEVIIEGQALIASFTKNTDEIKGATQAALDLSAATGTSLKSAFLLMGRAASGETSTLSRYGITLEKGLDASEKFAAALAKIEEQFGGQAQARAKTYSGLLQQIGNAYGDLWEVVGDGVTQNKELQAALKSIVDVLQGERVAELVRELGEALGTVTTKSVEVVSKTGDLARGIKSVGESTAETIEALKNLGSQAEETDIAVVTFINNFNEAVQDKVERIISSIWTGPISLVQALTALGEQERLQAEATAILIDAQTQMNAKWQESQAPLAALLGIHEDVAEAIDEHADAAERLAATQKAEAELTKSLEEVAKKYAVTLDSELNAALEANAEALDTAKKAMEAGLISGDKYAVLQEKIAASTAKLTEELTGAVPYAERLSRRLAELRETNEGLADAASRAGGNIDSLGNDMNDAALAADKAANAIDGVTDATARLEEIQAGPRRVQKIGEGVYLRRPGSALNPLGGGFGGGGSRGTVTPDGRVEY